mgnify:CR=1 FL=1
MKKVFLFILIILFPFWEALSQTTFEISEDLTFDFSKTKLEVSDAAKRIRASKKSGGGKIILKYMDETPVSDELITSLNVATDIWRDYIPYGRTLTLNIYFDDTLQSDIKLSILYQINPNNGLTYSAPLLREVLRNDNANDYDAKIYINTTKDWSFGIGEENAYKSKNLTLAFAQCICKCLGFGTSLKENNRNRIEFAVNRRLSIFDSYLHAGEHKLADYVSNSNALKQFATGNLGDVYFSSSDINVKLYTPEIFDNNYSMRYIEDENSFMGYNRNNKTKDLFIDDLTLNILKELGWNFLQQEKYAIVSDDIDSTGITSAYIPHEFYITPNTVNFTNIKWKLDLTLTDGSSTTFCSSNDKIFSIPEISNPDLYAHTIEGDIRGIITFEGVTNGEIVSLTYPIIFELKPRIISAKVISTNVNNNNPYYFDADVEIRYEGSHYINAYVEEEYSPYLVSYYSSTPYCSKIHLTNIASWGGAWFDITVRNEYGSDNYVLDLSYSENVYNIKTGINAPGKINNEISHIEAYNMQGQLVGRYNDSSYMDLPKGIYIIKFYKDNKCYKTSKICLN